MIPRRKEPAAKEAPASAASSSALAAPVRPLGTEEIVEVMRQEIAGPDGAPRDLPAPAAMQLAGLRTEAASLAELLGCDGPDFVALAYRTILRRNPDPEGTRYILDALAGGRTKVEMLGNLRYSPEGRRVRHPLPGLWLRYQAQRAYRAPVLGAGLLGARDVALGGRDARRRAEEMRRAAAAHAEAQAALQARLGAVGEAVSRLERALEEQRREFAGGMDRATQRLAGLEAAFRREPWADPILSLSDRTEDFERRLEALEMQLRNATDLVRALRAVGDEQGWSAEASGTGRTARGGSRRRPRRHGAIWPTSGAACRWSWRSCAAGRRTLRRRRDCGGRRSTCSTTCMSASRTVSAARARTSSAARNSTCRSWPNPARAARSVRCWMSGPAAANGWNCCASGG